MELVNIIYLRKFVKFPALEKNFLSVIHNAKAIGFSVFANALNKDSDQPASISTARPLMPERKPDGQTESSKHFRDW
jgi:hypothetical protein